MSNTPYTSHPPVLIGKKSLPAAFLIPGMLVAPVFLLVAVVQILTVPGFDIRQHAVSSLQNGQFGWIQSVNFIVSGIFALLFAMGARAVLQGRPGRRWIPILFAVFGAGMIVAGIFPPDPALGFPEGAPAGAPESFSTQGILHTVGFMGAFPALIANCFVCARSLGTESSAVRRLSIAVGVATPVLIALGSSAFPDHAGIFILAAGVVSFVWLSAIAVFLRQGVNK